MSAQNIVINKIEPPNWWEGMKHNKIQLMVYGEELHQLKIDNGELKITGIHEVENSNYLFVDVDLSDVKAGDYEILLSNRNSSAKN